MTEAQLKRYTDAWYHLLGELTTLDAMIGSFPPPENVTDPRAAYEIEDLARSLNALTANWQGVPA